MGYLPYSIIGDWQQLVKDFAYWRVDDAGARLRQPIPSTRPGWRPIASGARRRSWSTSALLSHFVGDGSMPLHASIHYNGWGLFPNPNGYTAGARARALGGRVCAPGGDAAGGEAPR